MDLSRFHEGERGRYDAALAEVERGLKTSHWMWFVFPQLRGLGRSVMSETYGIAGRAEAEAYLADPVLGPRLMRIAAAVLSHEGRRSAHDIFGPVDAMKLCSSMTLFSGMPGADPVFGQVLHAFCDGPCALTVARLHNEDDTKLS